MYIYALDDEFERLHKLMVENANGTDGCVHWAPTDVCTDGAQTGTHSRFHTDETKYFSPNIRITLSLSRYQQI